MKTATLIKKFCLIRASKNLRTGLSWKAGRNFQGRTTVYTKTFGPQTINYRKVSYRYKFFSNARVLSVILDKRRNAYLGLVVFMNGYVTNLLLPDGVSKGSQLGGYVCSDTPAGKMTGGFWSHVGKFPIGSLIYNVESVPYAGGTLSRAAGSYSLLVNKTKESAFLKLKSK